MLLSFVFSTLIRHNHTGILKNMEKFYLLILLLSQVNGWRKTAEVCSLCRCVPVIATIDCEARNLMSLPSFKGLADMYRQLNLRSNPLTSFDYDEILVKNVVVVNLLNTNISSCSDIKNIPTGVTVRSNLNCFFTATPKADPPTTYCTNDLSTTADLSTTDLSTSRRVSTNGDHRTTDFPTTDSPTAHPVTTDPATSDLSTTDLPTSDRPTSVHATTYPTLIVSTDNDFNMTMSVVDGQTNSFGAVIAAVVSSGLFTIFLTIVAICLCHKKYCERPTVVQMDRIGLEHVGPYMLQDDEITHYDAAESTV